MSHDRSDCGHMSGLLSRSHMTAAKMGFTARAPNIIAVTDTNGFHGVSRDCDRSIRSIFRSRASFGLRHEDDASRRNSWDGRKGHFDHLVCRGGARMLRFTDGGALSARAQGRQGWPQATAAGGAKRP